MKVSEAFLVNTKNFDPIIDALVAHESDEQVINSDLLEDLGYSDPNDLLVVRLLKDLNIIDNNGEAHTHYEEFQNPETTKKALAKGLIDAYDQLFDRHPKIHRATQDDIKEAFEEILKGKKTDLIIKYISGTFFKLVTYVGAPTIDALANGTELEPAPIQEGISENQKNGSSEDVSEKNIDDLVDDFENKKSKKTKDADDDIDFTIQEYTNEDHEENSEQDDPFGIEDKELSQPADIISEKEDDVDLNPEELDLPLSSAIQNNSPMSTLTTANTENQYVQKALFRKSELLHKMQRWEELIPSLEAIIERFDDTDEFPTLEEAVSRAYIRRSIAFLKCNQTEEALPALNAVISRLEDSEQQEFHEQVSRAMLFKAQILEKKDSNDLLPLYTAIIERMDSNSELPMKDKLDEIHIKRFNLILAQGEQSDVLNASTELVKRFKTDDKYQEYVQKAMIQRAEILDNMERFEEALEAYDEFLAAFGE